MGLNKNVLGLRHSNFQVDEANQGRKCMFVQASILLSGLPFGIHGFGCSVSRLSRSTLGCRVSNLQPGTSASAFSPKPLTGLLLTNLV